MKPEPKIRAEELAAALMESFTHAYKWHEKGMSVDAILIHHDIIAAYALTHDSVLKLHQRMIRTACDAVDQGCPLQEARGHVWEVLQSVVENAVRDMEAGRRPTNAKKTR